MIEAFGAKRAPSQGANDVFGLLEAARAEILIRQIEQAIGLARAQMGRAREKRRQAVQEAHVTRDEIALLALHACAALAGAREDLAHAAISRQIDLEARLIALADAERDAANAENRIERDLTTLIAGKKEMEARIAACIGPRRASARGPSPDLSDREAERSLYALQFARAKDATPLVASETGPKLDVARREQKISARLAAIKATM